LFAVVNENREKKKKKKGGTVPRTKRDEKERDAAGCRPLNSK